MLCFDVLAVFSLSTDKWKRLARKHAPIARCGRSASVRLIQTSSYALFEGIPSYSFASIGEQGIASLSGGN